MAIKEGDFVYLTREAAATCPGLAPVLYNGGKVVKIDGEVATVEVVRQEKVHISRITLSTSPDARDDHVL